MNPTLSEISFRLNQMKKLRVFTFGCTANDDNDDTRIASVRLFNGAKKAIKIIAGDITSEFYNDDLIISAFQNAINRGVSVEIAYDPHRVKGEVSESAISKLSKVKIWKLEKVPDRHMVIIDGKHVRVEQPHDANAVKTPALVCRGAKLLAKDLDLEFASLSKTASK